MNNEQIRIAIVGSRSFNDYNRMKAVMDKLIDSLDSNNIMIISGGAKGADKLSERYAREQGYRIKVYKADWNNIERPGARIKERYGRKYDADAGFVRNSLVQAVSHICAAFHNGSRGTADTIRKFRAAGKEVFEFKF